MKVGFIRESKKPDQVVRVYAMAAQHYGIEFFYFTPERINIETKTIKALFFVNGNFVEKETSYPDIIDNLGFLRTKHKKLYMELAKSCLFCHVSLGNKLEIHNIVKNTDYAIETMLYSQCDIDDLLLRHKQLIIKPARSSQAKNIYNLHRSEDGHLYLRLKSDITKLSKEEYFQKFHSQFTEGYIVSPYIRSVTAAGNPLNVRVLILRGRGGDWEVTKLVPRIGSVGTIIANLSTGSNFAFAKEFFPLEFGSDGEKVVNDLKACALTLADLIQKHYSRLIPLLGFDIGIDRDNDNKPKLFEVNTGAGIRPNEIETIEPLINFYKHLYMDFDKFHMVQNKELGVVSSTMDTFMETEEISYLHLLKIYSDCLNETQIKIKNNQLKMNKEIESLEKAIMAGYHHVDLYMGYLAKEKHVKLFRTKS